MTSITIKPRNKKELKAIKQFFNTFDIPFEEKDDTKMSKAEFFAMIEDRKKEVAEGKTFELTPENQKAFLGL
jgi:hypothetical protein